MQCLVELQPKMARLDELQGLGTRTVEDTAAGFTALLVSGLVHRRS